MTDALSTDELVRSVKVTIRRLLTDFSKQADDIMTIIQNTDNRLNERRYRYCNATNPIDTRLLRFDLDFLELKLTPFRRIKENLTMMGDMLDVIDIESLPSSGIEETMLFWGNNLCTILEEASTTSTNKIEDYIRSVKRRLTVIVGKEFSQSSFASNFYHDVRTKLKDRKHAITTLEIKVKALHDELKANSILHTIEQLHAHP